MDKDTVARRPEGDPCEGLLGPCREKLWTERSIEEKLETLRSHILELRSLILDSRERLYRIEAAFKKHDHLNGRVMVEAKDSGLSAPIGGNFTPMGLRDKE